MIQRIMTSTTSFAEANELVTLLANCASTCRVLVASPLMNLSKDIQLPNLSKLPRLLNDCAASCDIAILLIERKSDIAYRFLQVCEELAMECAWECSKYNVELCHECFSVCERVAKACLKFSEDFQ
jgi:hypothetical protein